MTSEFSMHIKRKISVGVFFVKSLVPEYHSTTSGAFWTTKRGLKSPWSIRNDFDYFRGPMNNNQRWFQGILNFIPNKIIQLSLCFRRKRFRLRVTKSHQNLLHCANASQIFQFKLIVHRSENSKVWINSIAVYLEIKQDHSGYAIKFWKVFQATFRKRILGFKKFSIKNSSLDQ